MSPTLDTLWHAAFGSGMSLRGRKPPNMVVVFIPSLLVDEIMRAPKTRLSERGEGGPPPMIPQKVLDEMLQNTEGVAQLSSLHEALKELRWRRLHQDKLENRLEALQKQIRESPAPKQSRLRKVMARLKF